MYQIEVLVEYGRLADSFTYLSDKEISSFKRVKIEFNNRLLIGLVVGCSLYEKSEIELKPIIEVIDKSPILTDELVELSQWMSDYYLCNLIRVVQTIMPSALRPSSTYQKPILEAWLRFVDFRELKSKKQSEALSFIKNRGLVKRVEVNSLYPNCSKALVDKGLVEVIYLEKDYQALNLEIEEDLVLSESQQKVYESLAKQDCYIANLLHGITGSGKSEIYLHLAKHWINQNKQVLILVPEIGLTPQMVSLFQRRLGDNVAIYHSKLNNQERYQQYQRVFKKEVKVVVGTRSAVFLPFSNLGCLIMDEEHDDSYKQENMPIYHTRDIVLWRAKYHKCSALLASATPSLESYARAIKGNYQLFELNQRVNGELPKITLVDMNKEVRKGYQIISKLLNNKIKTALDNNQQVILLLNRRGYTPLMKCSNCQTVITCPNCDIAMVYHKEEKLLKCHTCGVATKPPKACPSCHASDLLQLGYGTQRLVEEINTLFPGARVLRMDKDTTSRKMATQELLGEFSKGEADILVGTQMIAKGLDFPKVSLVGILNGDSLLNRLDFRAQETTFSLLTQASGRAGRVIKNSEVIIQAYQINHYALRYVVDHNYRGFFNQEMQYRKLANYPPYQYLILLTISGNELEKLIDTMEELKQKLIEEELNVLGPSELIKRFNRHYVRLTVKGRDLNNMQDKIKKILSDYSKYSINVDINPQHTEI